VQKLPSYQSNYKLAKDESIGIDCADIIVKVSLIQTELINVDKVNCVNIAILIISKSQCLQYLIGI